MKPNLKIGAAEYEVLDFFARTGEATVRQAADYFASSRGWGRTTVMKTIDRLREKGLLEREERESVFQYRSVQSKAQLEKALIDRFVQETLGGSVGPFVSYLQGQKDVSEADLERLKQLVDELEAKRKKR